MHQQKGEGLIIIYAAQLAIAELLNVFSRLAENPVLSNFNP